MNKYKLKGTIYVTMSSGKKKREKCNENSKIAE